MIKRWPHWRPVCILLVFLATWAVEHADFSWRPLWPSIVALITVLLSRRALFGLVTGAAAGTVLLAKGNPFLAFASFFGEHLIPSIQSDWRISVVLFTFLLGGFAALLDHGGGFRSLLGRWAGKVRNPTRRLQIEVYGLGLLCFFDGLANSMLVGRTMRPLADRLGLSRAKLAYIVDSTSSPVACVAVVSTWIAYQLSMIEEAYLAVGMEPAPYSTFLQSLPYNFYCWFSLGLVLLVILRNWNPGPMAGAEAKCRPLNDLVATPLMTSSGPVAAAIIPLIFLISSLLIGLYWSGAGAVAPSSFQEVATAFGRANAALVLVLSSALACVLAFALNHKPRGEVTASSAFQQGVTSLFVPVVILLAAWTLGSTLRGLGAAAYLGSLLEGGFPLVLLPAVTFLLGMVISFSTGTSWGTMGILTPLALPVALTLSGGEAGSAPLIAATLAAVFGGAVFGDHCSPLSDTTIVSSFSCGIEPMEHVRTQLPYALTAAALALVMGYAGLAAGLPVWLLLPAGFAGLWLVTRPRRGSPAGCSG